MAKWEAEYNQLMSSSRDDYDYDYGETMQGAWSDATAAQESPVKFDDDGLPVLGDYTFGKSSHHLQCGSYIQCVLQRPKTSIWILLHLPARSSPTPKRYWNKVDR